jgi:hypothetical protein
MCVLQSSNHKGITARAWPVVCMGVGGVAVMATLWAPFCVWSGDASCRDGIHAGAARVPCVCTPVQYVVHATQPRGVSLSRCAAVVLRLFPFSRGLFEDKVASVWCALDPLLKLRTRFAVPTLLRLW